MVDAIQQIFLRALAGCEGELGPKHTSTLDTVNNLGILYQGQGRYATATRFSNVREKSKKTATIHSASIALRFSSMNTLCGNMNQRTKKLLMDIYDLRINISISSPTVQGPNPKCRSPFSSPNMAHGRLLFDVCPHMRGWKMLFRRSQGFVEATWGA